MEVESAEEIASMEVKAEKFETQIIKTTTTPITAKLPQRYTEIYSSYTQKDYQKCLEIIDLVVEEEHVEYEILKSACLIHMGHKLSEAHQILDTILVKNPNNAYTIYAKGLAFYHEEKWEESVEYFERARELDRSPDMERADIMKHKAQSKININDSKQGIKPTPATIKQSSSLVYSSGGGIIRRFGCELCGHFFGKKFNLDRHNRAIHKRDTPEDFPMSPITIEQPSPVKTESIEDEEEEDNHFSAEDSVEPIESAKKKRSKPNPLSAFGIKSRVKCQVCKKFFKRGSLARHMIIHSGNKSHSCQTCGRSFYQRSDLIRHEATHSEELKFSCDLCLKKFRIKKNLQVHRRRHHSNVL